MERLTVYIGFDRNEVEAYYVLKRSIRKHSNCRIVPLRLTRLENQGLIYRPVQKGANGDMWDVLSQAPQSTEFAISRFLVPLMHQTGYAVFMDCDMLVYGNIEDILEHADESKAAWVVKHEHIPTETTKMVDKRQTSYARKNWSSVVLYNCDHPAHHYLRLEDINRLPGRVLHQLHWLDDDEIGDLDPKWNWLVNVQPKPDDLRIAHFTLGGPWLPGWETSENDDLWLKAQKDS